MLRICAAGCRKLSVPLLAILLVVGCAHDRASQPTAPSLSAAPSPTAAAPSTSGPQQQHTPQASVPQPPAPSQSVQQETGSAASSVPEEPAAPQPCSDDDLTVSSGQIESADTMRRVVVSFTNASSGVCALVGYPGADLVSAAGGVLVHVVRRPANAAHRLELNPGEVAIADVQASAIDTATGDACGRTGTLVVTPPNDFQSHLLEVNLPICAATISSVG